VVLAADGQLEQLALLVLVAAELETKMAALEALELLIPVVAVAVAVMGLVQGALVVLALLLFAMLGRKKVVVERIHQ
jgi:hypothetical protein